MHLWIFSCDQAALRMAKSVRQIQIQIQNMFIVNTKRYNIYTTVNIVSHMQYSPIVMRCNGMGIGACRPAANPGVLKMPPPPNLCIPMM